MDPFGATDSKGRARFFAGPAHRQGLPGVLVDDVEQLQPPVISGLVELEVEGPDVVRAIGPEQLCATLGPAALALAGSGPLEALRPPQALCALAIDAPALPAQDRMGGLPAPARVLSGDHPQAPAQLLFLVGDRSTGQALGRAPLAGDQARSSFGDPEAVHQGHHGPTAALRG